MQSSDFGPIVSPLARYAKGGRTKGHTQPHHLTVVIAQPPPQPHPAVQVLGALARAAIAHKIRQALIARAIAGMGQR